MSNQHTEVDSKTKRIYILYKHGEPAGIVGNKKDAERYAKEGFTIVVYGRIGGLNATSDSKK